MSETEILSYVQSYAGDAHGEQVRKYTGEKYIGHPMRVMMTVRAYCREPEVLAAALLHDVLEDTPVSARQMEEDLARIMDSRQVTRTVGLVVELTDVFIKNDFPQLSRRTRKEKEAARLATVSPEAQSIKYADIIDNVTDIVRQDSDFATVFVREAHNMLRAMRSGDAALRERALAVVDSCMKQLP